MEKVLVVTKQKLMFDEYAVLIGKYSASINVSMVSCYAEVLALLKREHSALVIFDMNITDLNGLELFLMLSGKSKTAKVLIVNVQPEDEFIFEMHRIGVTGLISTKADESEFMEAITAMIEGGKYFSPNIAEKIFFYKAKTDSLLKHKNLTAREVQVMIMLGKGWRLKEIAEHIYLSTKTISTYKARVYLKMGFENDSQLVGYLYEHNFF